MSASCVVTAMLLVARYAQRPSVGAFVDAGPDRGRRVSKARPMWAASPSRLRLLAAAPILLAGIDRSAAPPFCRRDGGRRCACRPASSRRSWSSNWRQSRRATTRRRSSFVLSRFSARCSRLRLRRILDLPAYWLIELPIEFPGDLPCRRDCVLGDAAERDAAAGKNRRSLALPASPARGLPPPGFWPARLATTTIWRCARFCRRPMVLIAATAAGMRALAAPRADRRHRARRAHSQPAGHGISDPLRRRRP